jgi:APA family basic amino acid/polyamine antiporter
MIVSLPGRTQLSALAWMVIGLVIYFSYSRKKSKLGSAGDALPKASDFEKQP